MPRLVTGPSPRGVPLGVVAVVLSLAAAPPEAMAPRGYVCQRAPGPLTIDGRLDEPGWSDATWTADFVDIEGDRRPRPRFRTRVKMLWDDHAFYIGARLEEPHVWATLTRHDSVIFHDNDFELFIDPDGDNHAYYEFEINALNTGWDLLLPRPYRDGGRARDDWEFAGMKTAVHVDGTLNDPADVDRAWTVEIALPWSALAEHAGQRGVPPREGDQWRVNFSRVQWRHEVVDGKYRVVPGTREDNWVWSPQGVVDMHQPEHWGHVQFTHGPPGRVPFRPDPDADLRDRLMRIYHAQKAHHAAHGDWAYKLEELGPGLADPIAGAERPVLRRVGHDDYEAAITRPGGTPRTWTVRSDSRLAIRPDGR